MSAPRPVSTPPLEVASRYPCAVVMNSCTACRWAARRVRKICRYHWLSMMLRAARPVQRQCRADRGQGLGHPADPGIDRRWVPWCHPREPVYVRLKAPPGIGAVQTLSGRHITIGENRIVEMCDEDANCLIPYGWTKIA